MRVSPKPSVRASSGHSFNQSRQRSRDVRGQSAGQVDRLGHDAQEHDATWVPIAPAGAVEHVGHADLMGRESRGHRRADVVALEPDERAGRRVVADRVNENHGIHVFDVRQQREPERAAVQHLNAFRDEVASLSTKSTAAGPTPSSVSSVLPRPRMSRLWCSLIDLRPCG